MRSRHAKNAARVLILWSAQMAFAQTVSVGPGAFSPSKVVLTFDELPADFIVGNHYQDKGIVFDNGKVDGRGMYYVSPPNLLYPTKNYYSMMSLVARNSAWISCCRSPTRWTAAVATRAAPMPRPGPARGGSTKTGSCRMALRC
jgi:hypothetical protein